MRKIGRWKTYEKGKHGERVRKVEKPHFFSLALFCRSFLLQLPRVSPFEHRRRRLSGHPTTMYVDTSQVEGLGSRTVSGYVVTCTYRGGSAFNFAMRARWWLPPHVCSYVCPPSPPQVALLSLSAMQYTCIHIFVYAKNMYKRVRVFADSSVNRPDGAWSFILPYFYLWWFHSHRDNRVESTKRVDSRSQTVLFYWDRRDEKKLPRLVWQKVY